jgi:hypothetical protein
MRLSGFQFTIRKLMIIAAIVALMLALVVRASSGDDRAMVVLGILMSSAPIWGSILLAMQPPVVTRLLLLASCAVILPISGYFFHGYLTTPVKDLSANEWLVLGVAALWLILPFAIGHALSKSFHAWRARNSQRCNGASASVPASEP